MFHLYPKPNPPQSYRLLETIGQAVDSCGGGRSLGSVENTSELNLRSRLIASRFSRPPCLFAIQPPAGPAVVEIEHGSHGIHAQPVDAIAIQPEHAAGRQEICHLVSDRNCK